MRRLNGEVALQNLRAVQEFEESSSKLTKWLIALTVLIAVLNVVLVFLTGALVWLGLHA